MPCCDGCAGRRWLYRPGKVACNVAVLAPFTQITRSDVLSDVLLKLLGFVVRVGLLLAAVGVFCQLVVGGFRVLILWLLRAMWAKLTGQPVSPWNFQVNRQAVWQRFNQGGFGQPGAAGRSVDVVDVEANDVTVVTDVEPKRSIPTELRRIDGAVCQVWRVCNKLHTAHSGRLNSWRARSVRARIKRHSV